MPFISSFYGLIVKMYFKGKEHNPPHFHVIYGEYMGAIDIKTGESLEGDLPATALSMIKKWTEKYRTELLNMWETQKITKLPPLE